MCGNYNCRKRRTEWPINNLLIFAGLLTPSSCGNYCALHSGGLMRHCCNYPVLCCTVLYCTVLYCTVLYCAALYCAVLYCTCRGWAPPRGGAALAAPAPPPPGLWCCAQPSCSLAHGRLIAMSFYAISFYFYLCPVGTFNEEKALVV